MVELVVFLHQFVAIVRHERRRIVSARLPHHGGKFCHVLHEADFLFGIVHSCECDLDAFFGQGNARICGLAQNGADTGVRVLDKRPRVAVEVDAFLGVEEHVLACVHLKQEVFQRAQPHDACHFGALLLVHVGKLAGLFHRCACLCNHARNQVVGIYHRSLAALHLAVGQFHHTVGEMHEVFAPLEAEFVEQDAQHLEVVVLLIAHHVDHLVDGEVLEAQRGGSDVLRHVDARAVGAEQEFVVEPLAREVGPHAAVFFLEEDALRQSFLHHALAHEVGVAFVIYLVEAYAECLIGFVEAGIHPFVHLAPQRAHFLVALLPFHEHLVRLLDERRVGLGLFRGSFFLHAFGHVLRFELCHFFAVVLVKRHVVVADKVVALLAARLRRFPVAVFQPGEHRFADMYAAVVHDVGLHHAVAARFQHARQGPAEQVVAHVSEVQRLVCVGRGIFHHHQRRAVRHGHDAIPLLRVDACEQLRPGFGRDAQVQEAAHGIEFSHGGTVFGEPRADFGGGFVGTLAREF